ncbi:MAG: hypothetical protein KDC03_23160, partial [Flavobacteriales bacterium]|nr:hypothetical protein [Flavobacteriales bacterium]
MSADKKKGAADNAPVRVDPTKIHILRVNMVQGKLETTDEYLSDPKEPEGVRFGFGHRSGIDKERSQIYTRLFIDMEAQDGEGEPLGVKAAYVFDFELK